MMEFTALFPFCGLGAGARGFLDARAELLGVGSQFRSLGGIDINAEACADFEWFTGSPALCADVAELTPAELQAFCPKCPDVIFSSPPCKGFSGLLSKKVSDGEKYQALNRLVTLWLELALAAWTERPRLILIENVPRIASRGKSLLQRVKKLLRAEGYVFNAGTHDCGELGGLAQHRVRYLLVARLPRRCPPLLYQPPRRRVRGCGEVLGQLPLPGTIEAESAGPLHRLPRLSWVNWVRLALIPAGGDWRDLPGVLEAGRARREAWGRHGCADWSEPTGTVAGSGSNGAGAVADPRVGLTCEPHRGVYGVARWGDPATTVTGNARVDTGTFSVSDPRLSDHPGRHLNQYRVLRWQYPSLTVIGATRPGSGALAVADPRTGGAFDHGWRVLHWSAPSFTVAGQTSPGCGAYQVADPRVDVEACDEVYGADELMGAWGGDPRKPPPFIPMIISPDGCWHRPLTTLELAALQGLPTELDGRPLELAGGAVGRWRERIGNAVPVGAAEAIGRQMLVALTEAELGEWTMGGGAVWVAPEESEERP